MKEENPSGIVFDITRNMYDVLNNVEHIFAKTERIRYFLLGSPEAEPDIVPVRSHDIVPVPGWLLQQKAILEHLVCVILKIDVLLNDLLKEGMDKE